MNLYRVTFGNPAREITTTIMVRAANEPQAIAEARTRSGDTRRARAAIATPEGAHQ